MKRCISALAAALLLALTLGAATASADTGTPQPGQTLTQSASNTGGDASQSFQNGGCTNTTAQPSTKGIVQRTTTARTVADYQAVKLSS